MAANVTVIPRGLYPAPAPSAPAPGSGLSATLWLVLGLAVLFALLIPWRVDAEEHIDLGVGKP